MNKLLVGLIARRVDDSVLRALSSIPSVWNSISPLLEDQYFWYLRTEAMFNLSSDFQWQGNERENWHQFYNVLVDVMTNGENPFSPLSMSSALEHNGYNLLAVKWLLKHGYNPGVDDSYSLDSATVYGSSEVVRLLLHDPRISPETASYMYPEKGALVQAAKRGDMKIMNVLLSDSRLTDRYRNICLSIEADIRAGHQDVAKLLLTRMTITDEYLDRLLKAAVEYNLIDILRLILDHPTAHLSEDINYISTMSMAIDCGYSDIIKLLLSREPWKSEMDKSWIGTAIVRGDEELLLLFLSLTSLTREDVTRYLSTSIMIRSINSVRALIKSGLLDEVHITSGLKEATSAHIPTEIFDVLMRSKTANFEIVPKYEMGWVISRTDKYTLDAVEGASKLSGLPSMKILGLIKYTSNNYDDDHFSMLLREIVLKRLDFGYYLDWLIKHVRRSTSIEVRRLISSTAASVLSDKAVVHTDPLFTAYSGFLLLANSRDMDANAILNTLEMEQGVTEEGLEKAGMLLGAFIGSRS